MLIGFTAVIAQIVLMRELMVVFCGNEMSLGLMLASWLLWTAIGSSGLGRLASRSPQPRRLMAVLEVIVALTFPLAIYLARASKGAFQSVPGEILGPGPMILTSLVVLSLFCLLSGGLFAVGSRLFAQEAGTSTLAGTSNVYLLEALGSGLGGILASLLLIRYFTSFQIAALLCLLNFLGAASLAIRSVRRRRAAGLALVGVFAFLVFPFGCPWLEKTSLKRLWSGFELVAARNSVYGNLAVVQTEGTRSLFENGLVAFNAPDPAAAEEAVHFALLQHPAPKSLLLIGGGVNGSLSQALQHPSLERIDYVELDPSVLDLAQEYFPAAWAPLRADPRVHVHNTDGRLFLRTTDLKFDVLIVNLPDPQTAQLNRFYTLEFFQEVASKLTPAGVFSFQLKASEDYISPDLAEFLRCIDNTLRQVFPEVATIPGDSVHFFAAARAGSLTNDSQELIARLRARHIRTSYVREYYLPYRMMPDRVLDLESQIRPDADTRTNRDFAPVAYYFDVALWSTRFNTAYRRVFQTMAAVRFGSARTDARIGSLRPCCSSALAASRGESFASQRRFLRRRDGIHFDRPGNAASAGISGHLWLRLPATRDHHCRLHAGHDLGEPLGAACRGPCHRSARRPPPLPPAVARRPFPSVVIPAVQRACRDQKPCHRFPGEPNIVSSAGGVVRFVWGISISNGHANLLFKLESQSKRSRNALCPGFGGRLCGSGCSQLVSGSCFWLPGNGLAYGCGELGAGGPCRFVDFGKTGCSGVKGSGALRSLNTIAENA